MNHPKRLLAVLGALVLVDCTPQAPQPAPGIDNPASPESTESAISRSDTLAAASSAAEAMEHPTVEPQPLMPEMQPGMKNMNHDMPAMEHGTPDGQQGVSATKPGENAALSAPRWTPATEPVSRPSAAAGYTCKMHPQVSSNVPGNCPICHMTLIPKSSQMEGQHAGHPPDADQQGGRP